MSPARLVLLWLLQARATEQIVSIRKLKVMSASHNGFIFNPLQLPCHYSPYLYSSIQNKPKLFMEIPIKRLGQGALKQKLILHSDSLKYGGSAVKQVLYLKCHRNYHNRSA